MSSTLHWRPTPPTLPPTGASSDLKHPLTKRYRLQYDEPYQLNSDDLPYLEGLRDAGMGDAATLIADIRDHGSVEVWVGE